MLSIEVQCEDAREQAHNLKVVGSNPAPATNLFKHLAENHNSQKVLWVAHGSQNSGVLTFRHVMRR